MGARFEWTREGKQFLDGIQRLDRTSKVPLAEMMTPEFVSTHSRFSDFEEFIASSPFEPKTAEDFLAIPDEAWDAYVAEATDFEGWQQMASVAGRDWLIRKLRGG